MVILGNIINILVKASKGIAKATYEIMEAIASWGKVEKKPIESTPWRPQPHLSFHIFNIVYFPMYSVFIFRLRPSFNSKPYYCKTKLSNFNASWIDNGKPWKVVLPIVIQLVNGSVNNELSTIWFLPRSHTMSHDSGKTDLDHLDKSNVRVRRFNQRFWLCVNYVYKISANWQDIKPTIELFW